MATLNTKTSVVDYLKSVGKDSSLSSRISLGKQYGVDYSATKDNYATENQALLKALTTPKAGGATDTTKKDITTVNNTTDAYNFINGTQDKDFSNASKVDDPAVKGGTTDYEDLISTFKETITGGTEKPETPNFLETYQDYRNSYGITDLESSLNTLKEKKQAILDAVDNLNYDEEGKPVALNVITGRQTEEQRQANRELQTIERQIENTANQLNTKYSIVDSLMTYTKLDYDTAIDTYDSQFSQNLQLFNTVKGIVDSQKSDKENEEDTARANLQIIYNGLTSGAIDNTAITSDMKATITKLELQSGLPVGFYESLQNKNPKSDILSTTTRETNGTKYADVILKNADGSLSTKSITLGNVDVGGKGDLSYTELLTQARAKVAPQIQAVRGADGYVAPENYQKARDAWVGSGLSAEDFDKSFKQYANPESYEKLGLSF